MKKIIISDELQKLIHFSQLGDSSAVSDALQKNNFSEQEIDIAFRELISFYKEDKDSYRSCFKNFIKFTNINYQNPDKNNSTILMQAIDSGIFQSSEKLIKFFKYQEGEAKININLYDNDGNSIVFKIISSDKFKSEDERFEFFNELISEKPDLSHQNNQGHTLLSFSLLTGNYCISEKLIHLGSSLLHVVSSNGDTLEHCAVRSRNGLCLYLIRFHLCKNGYTEEKKNLAEEYPRDLAKKLNCDIISQFYDDSKSLNKIEMLRYFTKGNYVQILNTLMKDVVDSERDNTSLKWNNLLCLYKTEYTEQTNKNSEMIATSFYNKIVSFFQDNKDKFGADPIMNANHIILKYKLDEREDIEQILNDFTNNFNDFSQKNLQISYWLCYIIGNLILLEEYIGLKMIPKANQVIEKVEMFLNNEKIKAELNKDEEKSPDENEINEYLNHCEVISQSKHCELFLEFLKCYKYSNEGNFEEAKTILNKLTQKFGGKKVPPEKKKGFLPIQRALYIFYNSLSTKLLYHSHKFEKIYYNITLLNNSFGTIGESIFYYNSLGIINLKKGKYKFAEFCFKNCERLLKENNQRELKILKVTKYMPCIWYNIGLCRFYSKKYDSALKIFSCCKLLKKCKENPCLYYRIGLCCLEKALQSSMRGRHNDVVKGVSKMDQGQEIILLRTKNQDLALSEQLMEAVVNFKECINMFNEEEKPQKYLIYVFNSAYINLLFTLIVLESWTDIVFFSEFYMKSKHYDPKNGLIVRNYLVQAYIYLGLREKALEVLKKEIEEEKEKSDEEEYEDEEHTFYCGLSNQNYRFVSYRIALYVNLIKINLIDGNREQVEMCIKNIIDILTKKNKDKSSDSITENSDIPPYLINIILYYLLQYKKTEDAVAFLKTRKIPEMEVFSF